MKTIYPNPNPTLRPMSDAQAKTYMKRNWVPRGHFHPCQFCDSTSTFRHVNREKIVQAVWCFDCGSMDEAVTGKPIKPKKWTTKTRIPICRPTEGDRVEVKTMRKVGPAHNKTEKKPLDTAALREAGISERMIKSLIERRTGV